MIIDRQIGPGRYGGSVGVAAVNIFRLMVVIVAQSGAYSLFQQSAVTGDDKSESRALMRLM